jgi:hypothetical protein
MLHVFRLVLEAPPYRRDGALGLLQLQQVLGEVTLSLDMWQHLVEDPGDPVPAGYCQSVVRDATVKFATDGSSACRQSCLLKQVSVAG